MWRFLFVLTALLSINDNIDTKFLVSSEPCGPPTISEYMNQRGVSSSNTFIVTAYLAIDKFENRFHGITFSGAPAKPFHTVAVDPEVVPLGTWLYIEGLGWWKAEDTGNMIKGNRLDICVPTRAEAMSWGKQNRQVWIAGPRELDNKNNMNTVLLSDNSSAGES